MGLNSSPHLKAQAPLAVTLIIQIKELQKVLNLLQASGLIQKTNNLTKEKALPGQEGLSFYSNVYHQQSLVTNTQIFF